MKSLRISKRFLRRIGIYLLSFGVLVALKSLWVCHIEVDGTSFSDSATKKDIFYRRAYLLEQIEKPNFGPQMMPFFLPDVFKEEWAIGTLSMTTAALTNIAFIYPETRESAELHSAA